MKISNLLMYSLLSSRPFYGFSFYSGKLHSVSRLGPIKSYSSDEKASLISRLIILMRCDVKRLFISSAKEKSGKTFDDIAKELGLTNAYTAQLFLNQAQLKPQKVELLSKLVPELSEADLQAMQKPPTRSFDPSILQEPLVYRLVEAMSHYGLGIKTLVNEKLGDGIISAIDIYVDVDTVKGDLGEDRVVLTLNGKFLPHIEQLASRNTAKKS